MVVILLILVTQQRVCNLGSVKNDRVIISDFGIIVDNKWNLSSFIGGFKSAINSKIDDYIDEQGLKIPKYNRNNHFFQPNYHDHIIRNHKEYLRIKNYIFNNPLRWEHDRFNAKEK